MQYLELKSDRLVINEAEQECICRILEVITKQVIWSGLSGFCDIKDERDEICLIYTN